MKLLKLTNQTLLRQIQYYSTHLKPEYPYTSELYHKNYIKYPVQSRSAICHDYVYHGDERLKTLDERLEEFKDPKDDLLKDIGKSAYYSKLSELKNEIDSVIRSNKANKDMEKKARDLQRTYKFFAHLF